MNFVFPSFFLCTIDNLYQSKREEKKLTDNSEAPSTSSEKEEISIMEAGEFSDDDVDHDLDG
jgi:hypothetical protein